MTDSPHRYLLDLPRFDVQGGLALKPGLERIKRLLRTLERPQDEFTSIHIAGTNGKGTTASMIAAIASAAGMRVGLHTSPHLFAFNELMRVDGRPAPDDWLVDAVTHYRDAFDRIRPSFFEATVALSFRYFADEQVDLAVVEVGLGGRLDATNVLQPALTCITSIGLDHTELLGVTLPAIAREKAGIVKPGIPLVTSARQDDVVAVLREAAAAQEAPFHHALEEAEMIEAHPLIEGASLHVQTPLRTYGDLELDLNGRHQYDNARLALRATEIALPSVQHEPRAVYDGFRSVRRLAGLRGRLDVLGTEPLIVADVAHNPEGLAAALDFVQDRLERRPHTGPGFLYVVMGLMRDKDAVGMARHLADHDAHVFAASLDTERALSAAALSAALDAHAVPHQSVDHPFDGYRLFRERARPEDALLIAGSHQILGEMRTLFEQAGSSHHE